MKENIIVLAQASAIILGYFVVAIPGIIGTMRARKGWLAINVCLCFAGIAGGAALQSASGHMSFISTLLGAYSAVAALLIAYQLITNTKFFDANRNF